MSSEKSKTMGQESFIPSLEPATSLEIALACAWCGKPCQITSLQVLNGQKHKPSTRPAMQLTEGGTILRQVRPACPGLLQNYSKPSNGAKVLIVVQVYNPVSCLCSQLDGRWTSIT